MFSIADLVGNRSDVTGVPYLVIGKSTMIGYADYNASKVKEMLEAEINKKPSDRTDYMKKYIDKLNNGEVTTTPVATTSTTKKKK
jgi:hypothetical protein